MHSQDVNPTPTKNPRAPNGRASQGGTFYNLQVVTVIAFFVATLFTAWMPASLLPGSLTEKLTQVLLSSPVTPSPSSPTPSPQSQQLIGIVAGHWGNDSGAICSNGLTEVEINLNIATYVKENLVAQGFKVDMLKEFDSRLEDYQALALLSIHADSCDYINDLATGFKVAAALANPQPERAARLTACMRDRYEKITGLTLHGHSVTPDMTSYHAFDDIHPQTTAVIIEVGFMNLDQQLLTKKPELIAQGITAGLLCFIYNESISQPNPP